MDRIETPMQTPWGHKIYTKNARVNEAQNMAQKTQEKRENKPQRIGIHIHTNHVY